MFFEGIFNSTNLPKNLIFLRKNELLQINSISCDFNFIHVNLNHCEILYDLEIIGKLIMAFIIIINLFLIIKCFL